MSAEPPMIKYQCPHCQARLMVPLNECGKESPCPECRRMVMAPEILGNLVPAAEAASGSRAPKVRLVPMGDRPAPGSGGGGRRDTRLPKPGEAPQAAPSRQFLPKPGAASEEPAGDKAAEAPEAAPQTAPRTDSAPSLPPLPAAASGKPATAAQKAGTTPSLPPLPAPAAAKAEAAECLLTALPQMMAGAPPLSINPFVTTPVPGASGLAAPKPVSGPSVPPPLPLYQAVPAARSQPSPLALRTTGSYRPAGRNQKQHWQVFLKSAAAIIILGSIVFLKLDKVAEKLIGVTDTDIGTLRHEGPDISVTPRQAKGPAKVIDSLSLSTQSSFTPQELREFPDLNCRFIMPEDSWVFDRDPWSREGAVFSLSKVPGAPNRQGREDIGEASFTLRVLPMGREASDQNHAAAAVQASLRALGGCRIRGREEVNLNGLLFSRIEVEELPFRFSRANAEVWLYSLNGMVYEMITAMPARTPPYYLSLAARRLTEGFSIIDAAKRLRSADVLALLETSGAVAVPGGEVRCGNVSITLNAELWSTWPGARNTLPGSTMNFGSRSGLRLAAAFSPLEGLPEDPARTASLIASIWPALRQFQWGRMDTRPHSGDLPTAVLRGSGTLNSRTGVAEIRAVRSGQSLMMLFAFGPGDTKPEVLTSHLDLFQVKPGGNGDPDFGIIEDREFHRAALAGCAEDATANGRHEEASRYHLTLFEWDRRPDDLCNASRSLAAAGRKDEALRLLTDQEGRHAGKPEWEVQKMLLLASIGQAAESRRVAANLLANGGLAAAAAAVYVETLIEAREFKEAQPFVKLLTEIDQSPLWQLYNALLLAETGERGKASKLIRYVRTSAPDDIELGVECVHVLMRCRLFPEALELARFLAVKNPQREQLQLLAAACHTALGHTAEAREAYQKILDANPSSATAREALSALAASSGQNGTEQIVNTAIPEVALPAALAAKLPKPNAPLAEEGGQSVVHLYRVTGIQLHTSQPLRETTRGAIRILDEEGMSLYNTMRFPVQPGAQRLCIHYLRVLDTAGKVLGQANLKDHYSLDAAGNGMAISGKVIHLPVPGLKPGCTIDYAYTIENSGSTGAIEYTRHVFAQAEPCRMDAWFITGDTAQMKFASSRNQQPERDGDSLVWLDTKPAVLNSSALASGDESSLPMLHAGTPSASWEKLGRDYLDQIRDRLAASEQVTHAAQDAIAGLRTPAERIAALSALVRGSVSYTAIEFGARAIIPNPAATTLSNRYGDCKDQAVLLHQLFSAAAIPSYLCVINSRGDIHPDFPCMAQFDHMIVALPGENAKSFEFIDPTNKYLEAVTGTAPVGLENRTALILKPDGPVLAKTQAFSAPSEVLTKRDISIRANQDAVLTDTITITGTRAARLRALLAPMPPLDRSAAMRALIGFDRLSHHVKEIRIQNIKELQAPLRINVQWEARRVLHQVDGRLRLALPTIVESHLIAPGGADVDDEEQPLRFNSSLRLRTETSLQVPPGHSMAELTGPAPEGESPFGKWSLAFSPPDQKRNARINWECALKAGIFPGSQRRAFTDFTHDSLRQLEGEWEFAADSVAKP